MSFLLKFLDWAHLGLLQNEEAQEYLTGRGVSKEQWSRHNLGYTVGEFVPDSKDDLDHNSDCGDKEKRNRWCDTCRYLRWSSTWEEVKGQFKRVQKMGRRIQGGIVLPLVTYSGSPIGFQVRTLKEKSYDSFVLSKRPEAFFFGMGTNLSKIWSSREVWIVEGPMDQLIMERLVSTNVLSVTTSALNRQQYKFLARFVDKVNLCLDLDKAGRQGARKFIGYEGSDQFEIRNVKCPKIGDTDKDVGDYWKKVGDEKFSAHFREYLSP